MKKHFIFLYLVLIFLLTFGISAKLIISPNTSIYNYIPVESNFVAEINLSNFFKEIGYQKIFNSDYIDNESGFSDIESEYNFIEECGIDFLSKAIIFSEKWNRKSIWFLLVKSSNQKKLTTFAHEYIKPILIESFDGFSIIQINSTDSIIQLEIKKHIELISENKIKSIQTLPGFETEFDLKNEVNIYFKTNEEKVISDAFYAFNFMSNEIKIDGHLNGINGITNIQYIKKSVSLDKPVSIRSTLGFIKSLELFKFPLLYSLPNYNQFYLDYDGTTLLTVNEETPVNIYPKLSLSLDIENKDRWQSYIDNLSNNEDIKISNDTIELQYFTKTVLKYKINESKFNLFYEPFNSESNEDTSLYFDLKLRPSHVLAKTFFKKDETNPPKMLAQLKINFIQSMLENFQFLESVDLIDLTINKQLDKTEFISSGKIVYLAESGHSIIESIVLSKHFMETFGALLDMN